MIINPYCLSCCKRQIDFEHCEIDENGEILKCANCAPQQQDENQMSEKSFDELREVLHQTVIDLSQYYCADVEKYVDQVFEKMKTGELDSSTIIHETLDTCIWTTDNELAALVPVLSADDGDCEATTPEDLPYFTIRRDVSDKFQELLEDLRGSIEDSLSEIIPDNHIQVEINRHCMRIAIHHPSAKDQHATVFAVKRLLYDPRGFVEKLKAFEVPETEFDTRIKEIENSNYCESSTDEQSEREEYAALLKKRDFAVCSAIWQLASES